MTRSTKTRRTPTVGDVMATRPNLTLEHTGGGCTALMHPRDGGGHIMITRTRDDRAPTPDYADDLLCGIYDADGQPVGDCDVVEVRNLARWIDLALSERRHLYSNLKCDCDACRVARADAKRAGTGWIEAAITAIQSAQKHYPPATAEWQACSRALDPLFKFMAKSKGGQA